MKKNNSRVSQQKAKRQNKKKKKAFSPQRGIINKLVSDNMKNMSGNATKVKDLGALDPKIQEWIAAKQEELNKENEENLEKENDEKVE